MYSIQLSMTVYVHKYIKSRVRVQYLYVVRNTKYLFDERSNFTNCVVVLIVRVPVVETGRECTMWIREGTYLKCRVPEGNEPTYAVVAFIRNVPEK
jgi:hypothetical protein